MCTGVVGTRSRGVCWDFFQQDSSTEINKLLIKLLIRIRWWPTENVLGVRLMWDPVEFAIVMKTILPYLQN